MGRPDWCLSIPFLSKLYVNDGLLFDVRNAIRQQDNAAVWQTITIGLLGPVAINAKKLEEEEGHWGPAHTMMGFDIDAYSMRNSLPEAKVAGPCSIA